MPKIYPVIRKIIAAVQQTNFVVFQNPGINLGTVLSAVIGSARTGVSIVAQKFGLTISQNTGIRITQYAQGSASVGQKAGTNLQPLYSGSSAKPEQLQGARITRLTFSLNRLVGGNAATLTTTGTQGWTNQANAEGLNNGSNARFAGNLTAARNGTLTLAYEDHVNKSTLNITSVVLRFYITVAGTALNNADVQLRYNIGSGDVSLQTITGDASNGTTPISFNITSAITAGGDPAVMWGRINNLITKVYADAAATEVYTVDLDAVTLQILADRTDAL